MYPVHLYSVVENQPGTCSIYATRDNSTLNPIFSRKVENSHALTKVLPDETIISNQIPLTVKGLNN